MRVAVVGGGLAGLSAALELVDRGHEVAVHSWDHRNHLRHSLRRTREQLSRVDLLGPPVSWHR